LAKGHYRFVCGLKRSAQGGLNRCGSFTAFMERFVGNRSDRTDGCFTVVFPKRKCCVFWALRRPRGSCQWLRDWKQSTCWRARVA
jgi:hypothetical protein